MWTFLINPEEIVRAIYDLNMAFLGHARLEEMQIMAGTCACESDMGKFRVQIDGGSARGIMQIEPTTAKDLWGRYLPNRRWSLFARFMEASFGITDASMFLYPQDEDLISAYLTVRDDVSIILARTKYLTDPRPIPTDLDGQAAYYKRVYNTAAGAGSSGKYLKAWADFGCADLVNMVYGI